MVYSGLVVVPFGRAEHSARGRLKYNKFASQSLQLPLNSPTLMCLILFAHQAVPEFPLVVAANRDEFFPRPTQQAQFWHKDEDEETQTRLLAGRDLQAGGTWLGIDRSGRFAAVTNIRDPSQYEAKPRTRGELPVNFLNSALSPAQYCDSLSDTFTEYAGYNLLVGDGQSMLFVNNFQRSIETLDPGIYGLSNASLNSPWPKITVGRERLGTLLENPGQLTTDQLIAMMADRHQAADADLPDTGVPLEMERQLSATFIHNTERDYGTRCSTAVIIEDNGLVRFSEQNFDSSGLATEYHFYEFPRESGHPVSG